MSVQIDNNCTFVFETFKYHLFLLLSTKKESLEEGKCYFGLREKGKIISKIVPTILFLITKAKTLQKYALQLTKRLTPIQTSQNN